MSAIEPIAIVGIGCRLPGGVRSTDDLWNLLSEGVDGVVDIPDQRWHLPSLYHPDPAKPGRMITRRGGFLDHIDRFDAEFFGISPREAARADPQQRLMLEVAYEAVEDAGLTMDLLAGRRVGVYVGIATWDYSFLQIKSEERNSVDAYTNIGTALCIAANRISYFFNLVGPSLAVDTACSSSLVATHLACRSIWNGESEMAFVGGVNVLVQPEVTIGFSKASMLSPDGRCKSFDSRANGYVRGEGAGVVILKPLARALADGDQIYALIRATAVNQDGRTAGISFPNRASQEACIVDALQLADIPPDAVQYVEAHGTGTPVGDPIEAAALGAVYGKARRRGNRCVIGSIKSNVGHLEAAAGMAGLIKAALCLRHRRIPANLHFERPNPEIPFDDLQLRVAQQLQPWPQTYGEPPRAGVNSFGFGGTNGHAILEAAPETDRAAPAAGDDGRAWMLLLSARSAPALPDLARSYLNALGKEGRLHGAALRDICFTANAKRSHHEFRLALVAHDQAELVEQLDAYLRGEERANCSTGRISGTSSTPVFVCSGMGQQWWAMGRELLSEEPVFRRAIEQVSDLFGPLAGWSLLDKLSADEQNSQLRGTRFGQPAIFALQVALAALWRSWGVEPAAVLGHSAGEMAAAHIAGVLSLEDAVLVTFHRSRLQHRLAGQGAMLAVGISRQVASRLVERYPGGISIAAINGARSVTLSGDAAALAEIDKELNAADIFSRTLQVDVPYHSPKMEQLEIELVEGLRDIRPRPASTPFYSTVTGTALPGPEADAAYWYRNVREPVLFHDTLGKVIEAGHRVFVEIGAHPILRHDIAGCLNQNALQGTSLCSLRREDRERAAMLGSLARLYTLGAESDWRKLYPSDARTVRLPTYPFQEECHWRESEQNRRIRVSRPVHPLLGIQLEASKPSWKSSLDSIDLDYLPDHRISGATVFPGAGYVEMVLAAAREILGPVPCTLEDIEFQKFLVLDQNGSPSVQLEFDPASSEFAVYSRPDDSSASWDVHARGWMRPLVGPISKKVDLLQIRERCPGSFDREECQRRFAAAGYHYGPAFQGMQELWRGEREMLAEVVVPAVLKERLSDYRLHPAVLDACFQTMLAAFPTWTKERGLDGEIFVPVKVERIRFHASPGTRMFAHTRVTNLSSTELKVDLHVVDEAGGCLVDVEGLTARQAGHRAHGLSNILYEYQWKPSPRETVRAGRDSGQLPSPEALSSFMQREGEVLRRWFDRARFQNEFCARSRAVAVAYIARALRQLGWTPMPTGKQPVDTLADRLGIAAHYRRWLELMLEKLTAAEVASTEEPHLLWKALWNDFPECQAELKHLRLCGENLSSVLRNEADPLNLIFPEGSLSGAEILYRDSPTFRLNNLLAQKAVAEIARRSPRGRALRILEIGGGTGGTTSFVLPVLSEHCTEYVFTDVSPRFTAHAHHKFARYPFVHYRTLDIERDPVEQGFEAHSFDLIIASDVLHATRNLHETLDHLKQLLGSGGTILVVELTRPWLYMTLIFGLLKGWWLFDDDVRQGEPCISQEAWKSLLREAGFEDVLCIADCPAADNAQHSVILARGPLLTASPALAPSNGVKPGTWLLFSDAGTATPPSVGVEVALRLRQRGDTVIEVAHGAECGRSGASFSIRAGNSDDMRRLMASVGRQAPRLAGVVHLRSLDMELSDAVSSDALVRSAKLGCVEVLHLLQAIAATDGLAVDGVWLVTRSAQAVDGGAGIQAVQSPLWGLGRVAINEYQNLRCRLVDLASCSREEVESLLEELVDGTGTEDEIALLGELRFVRRLVPVTPSTIHGMGRTAAEAPQEFGIEVLRPGNLDSLCARPIERKAPGFNEVEVEVVAAGLNFMDLMLVMGMLPPEVTEGPDRNLPGLEGAGRVVAVGEGVSDFAVGDEVIAAAKPGHLATHITSDVRFVVPKPRHLTFEQAATVPIAFATAFYSLHTLGRLQRGEQVLIHSATGGVGLAAVQLALNAGAIVFATAGSSEKRELLTALGVPHVMDSRSLAFADEVLALTKGEGVDLVLNSLAGDAIDKGLSVLRPYGRFIEIGKTDIYKNRKIGMRPLRKNISMFVVDLLGEPRPEFARSLMRELAGRFESGELRPLPHHVFPVTRVADAFRDMAQGRHIGKLIISMQDRAGLRVDRGSRQGFAIDPDAGYLITGGLGGFGLAVADRLARGGARHLALVGRKGLSPETEQAVESLRRRGAEVMICQADVTDREQVAQVLAAVQRMAPLRGVMHAAMVLDDAPIERLSEERMWKAMGPKIMGAWHLHALTADIPLDFFVLFSSFASIVGNPGQANYVAGNAFLDALAYYRRKRGLPALAINWGVVGEVGHVAASAEMTDRLARLGLKAMPLSETLDALEQLMSTDAVQVGVADVEWKGLLRATGMRASARYSALVGTGSSEESHLSLGSGVHDILEAEPAVLPSLVESYIRNHLARALGSAPGRIDTQQSLRNLGIDSLIAVEMRNRVNTDLGVNIPLAKLMQNESINTLAAFVAERLLERSTGEVSKSSAGADAGAALSDADAGKLLERIDELTDEEVEHHLRLLEPKGQA